MNKIEVFECDAEAVICGEVYDVSLVKGPDSDDMCLVDVPQGNGDFFERIAVVKDNIYPRTERAISLLMGI